MRLLGFRRLSMVLVVTLLFCHGVFGSLHLLCYSQHCAGDVDHPSEHLAEHPSAHPAEHRAAGGAGDAHEHPVGHATSTEYFAVLAVGFLGLLLRLLLKSAPLRIGLDARWPVVLRRVPAVLRPPPNPTLLTLRVLRL
jgi:hypothetical protein